MGFFARDRAEKVVEYHHYPEWIFITNRPRLRWWYRFLLGRPMDGVRHTNSTFLSPGSRGEPSWWLRLAGYQRLLLRLVMLWAALLIPTLTALVLMEQWSALHSLVRVHSLVAAPILILLEVHSLRERGVRVPALVRVERESDSVLRPQMLTLLEGRRDWTRDVVEPLAMALAESLDNVFRPGDTDWLHVPRNYLTPGGGKVEILLPTGFSGSMNAKVVVLQRAIANKLGMIDPVFEWQLTGRRPRVLVSAPPIPPRIAHFADFRSMLEATQEYRPFLGVVANGELLSAEMVSDSPHLALSAGSGAGKSVMARAVIMQVLRWGWGVVILDWKAESHSWAKGLPGVKYVTTTEGIHELGVRIGEEVDLRKENGMEGRANVLVVREEWNMTSVLLYEYWAQLRSMADPEEKRSMGVKSPALLGFNSLVFAGRQFGMFDLLIAQRMSNRVFNGNTDLRENYQIRLLARYSAQTWRMLIPEIKPMRKPKELGRWMVWAQDEVTSVQGILISDEEARAFSLAGRDNPHSPFAVNHYPLTNSEIIDGDDVEMGQRGNVGTLMPTMQGDQLPHGVTRGNELDSLMPRLKLRKLSDMIDTLSYLGVTLRSLQHMRDRDSDFPMSRGGNANSGLLYDVTEVSDYVKRKRASQRAEKEARK